MEVRPPAGSFLNDLLFCLMVVEDSGLLLFGDSDLGLLLIGFEVLAGLFKVWAAIVLPGQLVLRLNGWCGSGVVGGVAVGPPTESFLIDIWFCLTAVEDSGMPSVWLLSEIYSWAFWVSFKEEFGGGFWAPLVSSSLVGFMARPGGAMLLVVWVC
ncbi:hypothetical protein RHMOL_Rhmol09G0069500 [Rhododendron molle]|uniref:Uncharacterized protein n=1 Tax=Rhododendron molle TaxID=49168 RepID=A0ACC0MAW7_RHOML|nr:hypothetical protein RHMOL_Rhmol09G0069500 [Rhododendron molle]